MFFNSSYSTFIFIYLIEICARLYDIEINTINKAQQYLKQKISKEMHAKGEDNGTNRPS